MQINFFHPNSLSQQLLRVIFFIYLSVTILITTVQFTVEYFNTKDSILNELEQLVRTITTPISTSLWQYNEKQVESLAVGLLDMPIVEGIDITNQHDGVIVSKRSYKKTSEPLSLFSVSSDLSWTSNGESIPLGSLTIYSTSQVIFDRIVFNFFLIFVSTIIKITTLFLLFIWAFNRFLAIPLTQLISQVDELRLNRKAGRRIMLTVSEKNELHQLQEHMNLMLSDIEIHQKTLLEDEKNKRAWLENAVESRTAELLIANEKLKNLAAKDSLTGILNRGSFYDQANPIFSANQNSRKATSFIMIDLDHFKIINDTHGHFIGDKVLVHFTRISESFLRRSDIFGRIGGEEFAIFLPDTETDVATQLANKIRKAIGASALEVDGHRITYTVSLGVASSDPRDISVDELLKRADLKLYEAKNNGRDRVQN